MTTGINSDLAGSIIARVAQNVYDTPVGRYLLIPQGATLVGVYASDVVYGQNRVLVAWQRIVFPDGKALDLGTMPGTDGAGYAGFADQVNNHYLRIFGSAFLMSAIVAGVSMSQDRSDSDYGNSSQRAGDAMSEALGQQLGNTMSQMISKNLNIAPTIEVRPGYRFNIVVVKDLNFTRPYGRLPY
jgi:type IV secretion system protein VirB10